MSQITKHVNRAIPPNERTVTFDENDASQGDILMVSSSLGHPGSKIDIEATDALTVRFNTLQKVYPRRYSSDLMYTDHLPNLALEQEVTISGNLSEIVLDAGESWNADDDFPIKTVELVAVGGAFSIQVS